jgi:hypothetical protein
VKTQEVVEPQSKEVTDLIVPEEALPGHITLKDYYNLLSFGPGLWGFILFFVACALTAVVQMATSLTLANWTG